MLSLLSQKNRKVELASAKKQKPRLFWKKNNSYDFQEFGCSATDNFLFKEALDKE